MYKTAMCLFFLLINSDLLGQPDALWQKMKLKYPEEQAVFLNRSESVVISMKSDSLQAYSDIFEEVLLLKSQPEIHLNRRIYGSHFNKISELTAKTFVLDKSHYNEQSVSGFSKKSDNDDGIFYDDSYYYTFSFPSIAAKNKTQLRYRNQFKDLRFLPGYVFSSYLPHEKSTYTIQAPKDVELVYKVWNDPDNRIQFQKSQKGNSITYEWTASDVKAWKIDENSPPLRYFVPHLVVYIKSYGTGAVKRNMLSGLDDLFAWYSTFLSKLDVPPSKELTEIVSKLIQPSDTELEKVKRIFYWVQENIRYIAFEEGMRGLIPHTGSYVCEKRYGDCKDMASIIVDMMRIAGVKGYYTWIGTRDLPYKYSQLPTPLVDNHMIATYIAQGNNYYYLDGTSNHTAFGLPSSMIQGKEVLIGKGTKEYEVRTVPEIEKSVNRMTDSTELVINGVDLQGTGVATLSGLVKTFGGYELDRAQKQTEEKYVEKILSKGSNKFLIDNYEIINLNIHDLPTQIKYKFHIGDYFKKTGNEIYINLNLFKDYYNTYLPVDRLTPRENDYKYVKEEITTLIIPDGYEVEYLPEGMVERGPFIGLELSYTHVKSKIILRKKFYLDYLLLRPENFPQWNESVKKISIAYKESIILKKK